MKLFYSGNCADGALPETVLPERKPDIMLTFYDFKEGNSGTKRRYRNLRKARAEIEDKLREK